ncbi:MULTISPECIES: NADH-quinone oxidoreductase subunit C [Lacrimispora]|jgi:ech hydrogenase subunit D|uniref:Ech hydrogenase subunit D n=1 Tax=Lacrimispora sphenoides JCM 1415 TaxID=1297793 RepID=A0ABY1CA77_9FIRM|nr:MULTISPECIES: NADH-quinone oxidoreductase subunit C [Lacrimispora]EXG87515.1 ech hydrogenase subunit D [Clostridium sp. ASBs410]MDR7811106.1 NADH-quinone oxidoreductase subunit C [Lacrimispora sp.]SET83516.1 ech hydrogenase subunit D [[Clostridium] sphenoides JCM 1415]SUY51640.1 ech hydrogenase, subunit EchD [Lacrimispora sphenoides]
MAEQILKEISANDLLAETLKIKNDGYRLVAVTCTNKDGMELTYSFDKDHDLINLRILTDTETELPSISIIYPYSFLYENEIKELFGVKITGITPDFNDNLYKIPVKTPFHMND